MNTPKLYTYCNNIKNGFFDSLRSLRMTSIPFGFLCHSEERSDEESVFKASEAGIILYIGDPEQFHQLLVTPGAHIGNGLVLHGLDDALF